MPRPLFQNLPDKSRKRAGTTFFRIGAGVSETFSRPFFKPIMPEPITYYALSPSELERIVREAKGDDWMTAAAIGKMWGCSSDFIKDIAKEHNIVPLGVPGHGKIKLYPIEQIKQLFKPIQ